MLKLKVINLSGVEDAEIELSGPMAVTGTIRQGKSSVTRDAMEFVMTGSSRKYVRKAKGATPTVLINENNQSKPAIVQLIHTSDAGDLVLERKVMPSSKMSMELTLDGMPRGGANADDKLSTFCKELGGIEPDLLKYIFNPFTLVSTNSQDLKKALQDHLASADPEAVEGQLAIFEDIPEAKRKVMAQDIARLGLEGVYKSINQAQREAAGDLREKEASITDEPEAVEVTIDEQVFNSKTTPIHEISRHRDTLTFEISGTGDDISALRAERDKKPMYSAQQTADMKTKKSTLETLIKNTNSEIIDADSKKNDYNTEFESLANVGISLRDRKQSLLDKLSEYDLKSQSILHTVAAWESLASQDEPCCLECSRPWTDTDIANKVSQAKAELSSHTKTVDIAAIEVEISEIDTELAANQISLDTVKVKNADANNQNANSESSLRDFEHKLEMAISQITEAESFDAPDLDGIDAKMQELVSHKAEAVACYEKLVEVLGASSLYRQWSTANTDRRRAVDTARARHEILKKQEAAVHPQNSAISESFGASGLQEFRQIMVTVSDWLDEPIALDDNYAITYAGRPVMEGSTSEQYSAGIVVQTAIAMFAKWPVMVMDFGDTLQNADAMNKYLGMMKKLIDKDYFDAAIAVLSTDSEPEDITYPPSYTVYYMEDGAAKLLQRGA